MKERELRGNKDPKIVALGVTSSISIYKACEVLRGFQKKGCRVRVVMTPNAARLVSPLLFGALSGEDAIVDLFDERVSRRVGHVALAREISLLCVAPATANVIAKFASGVADDFLSTLYLAIRCPVLVAPAMNEAMYLHPRTRENIRKLRGAGVEFVEPEKGYLACHDEGWGRLASPERIVEEGLRILARTESLKGIRILVTAGPTREYLDPVRFLSNASSGKMGYEIAREAASRGARRDAHLGTGPARPSGRGPGGQGPHGRGDGEGGPGGLPRFRTRHHGRRRLRLPLHRDRPAEDREAGPGREGRLGRDARHPENARGRERRGKCSWGSRRRPRIPSPTPS